MRATVSGQSNAAGPRPAAGVSVWAAVPKASVRRHRLRPLHGGHPVLHRILHLLEGAHFDLAHPLARDAELVGELLERDRVVGKPTGLKNPPLAVIEHAERLAQRLAAVVELLALRQHAFLA